MKSSYGLRSPHTITNSYPKRKTFRLADNLRGRLVKVCSFGKGNLCGIRLCLGKYSEIRSTHLSDTIRSIWTATLNGRITGNSQVIPKCLKSRDFGNLPERMSSTELAQNAVLRDQMSARCFTSGPTSQRHR
jgi:hypothetical protein